MILFSDTSAIIKLFVTENGSESMFVRSEKAIAVAVCWPRTLAELHAALARRLRENYVTPAQYDEILGNLKVYRSTWLQVPVLDEALVNVDGLCRRYSLRGADALQLCAAIWLAAQNHQVTFASSDQRLLRAASSQGLLVFDRTDP